MKRSILAYLAISVHRLRAVQQRNLPNAANFNAIHDKNIWQSKFRFGRGNRLKSFRLSLQTPPMFSKSFFNSYVLLC